MKGIPHTGSLAPATASASGLFACVYIYVYNMYVSANDPKLIEYANRWHEAAQDTVNAIVAHRNGMIQLPELFAILLGRGAAIGIVASSQYPEWGGRWSRMLTNGLGAGNHPLWGDAAELFFDLPIGEDGPPEPDGLEAIDFGALGAEDAPDED